MYVSILVATRRSHYNVSYLSNARATKTNIPQTKRFFTHHRRKSQWTELLLTRLIFPNHWFNMSRTDTRGYPCHKHVRCTQTQTTAQRKSNGQVIILYYFIVLHFLVVDCRNISHTHKKKPSVHWWHQMWHIPEKKKSVVSLFDGIFFCNVFNSHRFSLYLYSQTHWINKQKRYDFTFSSTATIMCNDTTK